MTILISPDDLDLANPATMEELAKLSINAIQNNSARPLGRANWAIHYSNDDTIDYEPVTDYHGHCMLEFESLTESKLLSIGTDRSVVNYLDLKDEASCFNNNSIIN